MKYLVSFIIIIFLFSCKNKESNDFSAEKQEEIIQVNNNFQDILDDNRVEGVILILEDKTGIYHTNNKQAINTGHLPASTFKIPNSIISLEEGVATVDRVFEWDGQPKYLQSWEQDMNLQQAFQNSCVHCYQQLAREIGLEKMTKKLDEIEYPKMDIHADNIDTFWLTGESRITPKEQIEFLRRFNEGELPISKNTSEAMQKIMLLTEAEAGTLYGKTGLSVDQAMRNGWFVGFVTTADNTYYFATNITQTPTVDNQKFQRIRVPITLLALQEMGVDFLEHDTKKP